MNQLSTVLGSLLARVREFIRAAEPGSESAFQELALTLFDFQFTHNPAYRIFCQRSGRTPGMVQSWEQIPAIVTGAFKDLDLTVLPATDRPRVFHSSGTTQHRPSRHYHNGATLAVYEESLLAWFKPHLLPDLNQAQFLVLAPPASLAPHSSLAHMFSCVSGRWGSAAANFSGTIEADGSWNLDFERLNTVIAGVQQNESPAVICGTAFSFVHWCDHLAGLGQRLTLPTGSRVFETGGYKGRSRVVPKEQLHEMIEDRLGIGQECIVSEYGMSELSSQGYDRIVGSLAPRLIHFPPWARFQIISPETLQPAHEGQTGLVRVFDLANVSSVMAIQTEDLAIHRGEGFELLGRAALSEPRGCSLLELRS